LRIRGGWVRTEKGRKEAGRSEFSSHKATTRSLTMVHYSSGCHRALMLDQFYMDGSNNGLYYCYYTKPAIMTIKR